MASLAQYYQALADDDANSHGIAICRLQVAEASAKDATRAAGSFPNNAPANSNLASDTGSILSEMTKKHLANVQDPCADRNASTWCLDATVHPRTRGSSLRWCTTWLELDFITRCKKLLFHSLSALAKAGCMHEQACTE